MPPIDRIRVDQQDAAQRQLDLHSRLHRQAFSRPASEAQVPEMRASPVAGFPEKAGRAQSCL
jgi:hypothetical protein